MIQDTRTEAGQATSPSRHQPPPPIVRLWGNLKTQCKLSSTCRAAGSEPTTYLQWGNCANHDLSLVFIPAVTDVAGENDSFYPRPRSSGCTFRPLGVFPFSVLLMEGKWSRSAGSLTTELSWWFGCVSIRTSQKRFNSCISLHSRAEERPLWPSREPIPCLMAFQDEHREQTRREKGFSPEVFFILFLNSVGFLLAFWKGQINNKTGRC